MLKGVIYIYTTMSSYPKILVSNANNNNSLNGNVLTSLTLPPLNNGGVFYNGSYYLVGANAVVQSPDAINWSPTPTVISGMSTISNFAWNTPFKGTSSIKPLTIACGEGNNTLAYSKDGIYWNGIGKNIFTTRANKAIWNGVLWAAVGTGGFWVATSYDGITWTGRDKTLMTEGYDIAWNGSVFVAAGHGGQTPLVASADGVNWYGIPSSSPIFSIAASSISWTGKAWVAYGSGGNTTAVSNSADAWLWNATSQQNLAITDASSVFWQTGYPQVDTSNITASSIFSDSYSAYNACDNSMNSMSSTEWRSLSGSYDITTGINTSSIITIYNHSLTVSGEWIQIKNDKPIIANYYHLSWYIDNPTQSGYAIPKEYYLLGSNDGSTWNDIDYNIINHTSNNDVDVNISQNPYFVNFKNISSNRKAYQYYRLVIPSILPGNTDFVRISEFDIFQANPSTTHLNRFIKPIITKTHVLHPTSIIPFSEMVGKQTIYQITDLQCNPIQNTVINNGNPINCIINGAGSEFITSTCFDGENLIVTPMTGNILYMSNNSLNTNLLFDVSINGTLFTKNITGNVYSSCFNGQRIILAGTGGHVITYSCSLDKSPNAVFYPSVNANNLFTSVYGVSSNPGYGFVYSPNRIYFDAGEKVSIVTPKSYSKNLVNNTNISMNLINSSILHQVTFPNSSYIFSLLGSVGPIGVTGNTGNAPTGPTGPHGVTGPDGSIGPKGLMGISPTGTVGYTGPTGEMGYKGITGVAGHIGNKGLMGHVGLPGEIGPTGERGDTNYESWILIGNSGSAYINNNVSLGTNISTTTIDISGNMNDSGLLIANRLQTGAITSNTVGIANISSNSCVLDVSGNVLISDSLFVNKQPESTSQNNYIVDVSGASRVFSLYSNKNYSYVFLPTAINTNNVVVDYSIGDSFMVDGSSTITDNFSCIVNNLPIDKLPFASFNIVLIINYTNTNIDRYYCNSLVINGTTYYPNFNGGNPTAITGFNLATNTYIQKFSIICVNSSIWKLFCESENYSS